MGQKKTSFNNRLVYLYTNKQNKLDMYFYIINLKPIYEAHYLINTLRMTYPLIFKYKS